jgi:dienelactone hydrolase
MRWRSCAVAVTMLAACTLPPAAAAPVRPEPFSLPDQLANLSLATTRSHDLSPALLAAATRLAARQAQERTRALAADPARRPDANFCTTGLCVGDPRLEGWSGRGGLVRPVLFTARSGATLAGHVWATRSGPARRPGVVIVNGSIIGFEQAYWWAAQTLAKAGYVVLTFDAQGEGMSDQLGADPDQLEGLVAGAPPIGDGIPFYDGGQDAVDFLVSTPAHPYAPRRSRTSATSHVVKQRTRVARGLNPAANPLWRLLDRSRIGIAGHSYGAEAASYLGQYDRRIDAVVAWDALCTPRDANRSELGGLLLPRVDSGGTLLGLPLPAALVALPRTCFGAPRGYPADVPLRVPSLGITGDYVLPSVFLDRPSPGAKAASSTDYSRAGVDTASITVRGASHVDWTWVASAPLATLRGVDMGAWYTVAWFDKYLRGDPTADRRLLTRRWAADSSNAAVDPARDPNMFSRWFRSRIDIRLASGRRVRCENLRSGCATSWTASTDCGPRHPFDHLAVATAPDPATDLVRRAC